MYLMYLAMICCDHCDDRMLCTETNQWRQVANSTMEEFAEKATEYFKSKGWHIEPENNLCPNHNKETT